MHFRICLFLSYFFAFFMWINPATATDLMDIQMNNDTSKDLFRVYGFCAGQDHMLKIIERKFTDLSIEVLLARTKFKGTFGNACNNSESLLKNITGEEWNDYQTKMMQQIDSVAPEESINKEAAKAFIELVSKRAGGEIEPSILEAILCFNPFFQEHPEKEVSAGFKKVFRTRGLAKSKGLDIQMEYPVSWKIRDGKRPNVVQFFQSGNGNGVVYGLILIKDMVKELGSEMTASDKALFESVDGANVIAATLFSDDSLKEMARASVIKDMKFISSKRLVIDGWPGAMSEFIGEAQRLDFSLSEYNRLYAFVYKNFLVNIWFQIFRMDSDSDDKFNSRIKRYSSLFHWMANSIVIQSQY